MNTPLVTRIRTDKTDAVKARTGRVSDLCMAERLAEPSPSRVFIVVCHPHLVFQMDATGRSFMDPSESQGLGPLPRRSGPGANSHRTARSVARSSEPTSDQVGGIKLLVTGAGPKCRRRDTGPVRRGSVHCPPSDPLTSSLCVRHGCPFVRRPSVAATAGQPSSRSAPSRRASPGPRRKRTGACSASAGALPMRCESGPVGAAARLGPRRRGRP